MFAERSQTVINRFGLAMGASAVSAKTAEAAGIINTGVGAMTLADWAIVVTIFGGIIYAANQLVTLYERLIEIRAKRAAAGIKCTPPWVSALAMAGAAGVAYSTVQVVLWAIS
jgi:hypothetical protein